MIAKKNLDFISLILTSMQLNFVVFIIILCHLLFFLVPHRSIKIILFFDYKNILSLPTDTKQLLEKQSKKGAVFCWYLFYVC